ncbi:MAG: DNA-protecting protein DprA [candidate division Zixibacteria bacterium]|nr:DNA-protecting protein DprA [candidate division Zixibacteria bacterium]
MTDVGTDNRDTQTSQSRIPADAEYWLALGRLPGIGRATYLKLIETYQSPRVAWEHSDSDWKDAGATRGEINAASARGEALAWARTQIDKLAKSKWSLVVYGSEGYPHRLASLKYPPPYLFMRGSIPDQIGVAVVGSRKSSEYGIRAARMISGDLAAAGVMIVSGFARGIDRVAHEAALDAKGKTIAVWGAGPDVVYPRENEELVEPIAESGALITEFAFGAAPEAQNFPVRNRLIAGLSEGVLVVQAREKSGALLTAQHALEQGKDVYAVPGEIANPHSAGANELLKAGAQVVTSADDILTQLGLQGGPRPKSSDADIAMPMPHLTPVEQRVFDSLRGSTCHVDRLAVSLQMSAAECAAVLLSLQLKGVVKQAAGNMFVCAR